MDRRTALGWAAATGLVVAASAVAVTSAFGLLGGTDRPSLGRTGPLGTAPSRVGPTSAVPTVPSAPGTAPTSTVPTTEVTRPGMPPVTVDDHHDDDRWDDDHHDDDRWDDDGEHRDGDRRRGHDDDDD